jgi:hypothetical protein
LSVDGARQYGSPSRSPARNSGVAIAGIARIVGVPLTFAGIALGVAAKGQGEQQGDRGHDHNQRQDKHDQRGDQGRVVRGRIP